jgi:putative ABC transport system substrate-binding protein
MRRRDFISLVGGAATTWPLVASAQHEERVRLVGVLESISAGTPGADTRYAAFLEGLQQLGWTPGRNVRIEVRYAEAMKLHYEKMQRSSLRLPRTCLWLGAISRQRR